jgi:hypothetical protein
VIPGANTAAITIATMISSPATNSQTAVAALRRRGSPRFLPRVPFGYPIERLDLAPDPLTSLVRRLVFGRHWGDAPLLSARIPLYD